MPGNESEDGYMFKHAIKQGLGFMLPALPLMNLSFQSANEAARQNISTYQAIRRNYQFGFKYLFRDIKPLLLPQVTRTVLKTSLLSVGLPYVDKHWQGYGKVAVAGALTLTDMLINPLETFLSRGLTGFRPFYTMGAYYRQTMPNLWLSSWLWGTYIGSKTAVDYGYRQLGFNPHSRKGALATSPIIAATISLPIHPFFVLQARETQTKQASVGSHRASFFNSLRKIKHIAKTEGVRVLYRGLPGAIFGVSALVFVANNMVLWGERRKITDEDEAVDERSMMPF